MRTLIRLDREKNLVMVSIMVNQGRLTYRTTSNVDMVSLTLRRFPIGYYMRNVPNSVPIMSEPNQQISETYTFIPFLRLRNVAYWSQGQSNARQIPVKCRLLSASSCLYRCKGNCITYQYNHLP